MLKRKARRARTLCVSRHGHGAGHRECFVKELRLAAGRCGSYTCKIAIAAANTGFASSARNPMPLSAIIVDDEQLARDELAYLLKNAATSTSFAQGKNGLEPST